MKCDPSAVSDKLPIFALQDAKVLFIHNNNIIIMIFMGMPFGESLCRVK